MAVKPEIMNETIAIARRVLNDEAKALVALSESIGAPFAEAIERIHAMKYPTRTDKSDKDIGAHAAASGRLIVAGIGKSGHVARKIAATLASTGTPSYFVHPGEASHGDMGMITANDIVLMLSNSGENAELSDLIHYTRRYNIPLIAMTGRAESSLARHADIVLLLPPMGEACPNGLAPTTSTTMMIALGDALAVSLLEKMNLTPDQYKVFHPGGKLGQKLMSVAELMIPYDRLPLISEKAQMGEAIVVMTEKNLGSVLILDDTGALLGIITDGDLKRHMAPDLLEKLVTAIMSKSPMTIRDDILAVRALDIMTKDPKRYLTSLVVTDAQGKLSGMIRLQDCLQAGLA
ncbi:MAG: SIS domain-containing protein [Alphaproteobacteria bacterium]